MSESSEESYGVWHTPGMTIRIEIPSVQGLTLDELQLLAELSQRIHRDYPCENGINRPVARNKQMAPMIT